MTDRENNTATPPKPQLVLDPVTDKLTLEERERFTELDVVVRAAVDRLMEAAVALEEIKTKKLYRARFKSFDLYTREVFKMSRQSADYMIQARKTHDEMTKIVADFNLTVDQIPTTESQLRVLSKVKDPVQRCEILANEIASKGEQYTAADLTKRIRVILGIGRETERPLSPTGKLAAARDEFEQLFELLASYNLNSECLRLLNELRNLLAA